jgi:anthranilate phosphoribosyltransferase
MTDDAQQPASTTTNSLSAPLGVRPSGEGIRTGLRLVAEGTRPSRALITEIFREIMAGVATPAQIGGLLIGLRRVGETQETITGAAQAMREALIPIPCARAPVIDCCGTGGSGIPRRNVSTAVAFAVAACGVAVAKHGNRGISSRSGSADVLERLGVNIRATPTTVGRCLDAVGVGFLFAPSLHPAMKFAAAPRRELGVRTLFNLLGPLTNPAGVSRQVVGVYDPHRVEELARALGSLGSARVFVVHGFRAGVTLRAPTGELAALKAAPALDDLSPEGESLVVEWTGAEIVTHVLTPDMAGIDPVPIADLAGGSPEENAAAMVRMLDGERGAYRSAVQYSGALALLVAGDDGLEALPSLATQIGEALDSGAARRTMDALVAHSHGRVIDSIG